MKQAGTEDVLQSTFAYLEKVLNNEIADRDGFIRRTALQVEQELSPAAENEPETPRGKRIEIKS